MLRLFCFLGRIGEKLGSGHFGTVHQGVWKFEGGCLDVAIKTLKPNLGAKEQEKFLQEAVTMGQFFHQNVVQLHGVISIGEPVNLNQCNLGMVVY